MFDEELFLQIAKEMVIEVSKYSGKNMIDVAELDVMKIFLEPFQKTIEGMAEEYKNMTEINKKQEIIEDLIKVKNVINDLPNERYKHIPTRIHLSLEMLDDVINKIEDELVEKE
ncbi:MAG: hypothetical protein ACLURU_07595 [Finegoldia magna]